MSTDAVQGCDERLDVATLNAWRDGVLDPSQAQRLTRHLSSCVACQAQLDEYAEQAAALRSIQTPEPVYGYGHNPRRGTSAPADHRGHASHRVRLRLRLVGGLGAVAAVMLLALGFTQIFAALSHHGVTGPTVRATPIPTATATPVPTIVPGQYTPIVSLQDAWGSHAASAQLNAVLDAKQSFRPESVTPDGRQLLGTLYTFGAAAPHVYTEQAGMLDVATRHFTPIGSALPHSAMGGVVSYAICIPSDERYVVCEDEVGSAPNSPTVGTLWSYDLVSKQARMITDTHHYAFFADQMTESHGTLVFTTGKQAYQVDLATNAIAPLSLPSQGPLVTGFSWPYLVYFDQPGYWYEPPPTQVPNVRAHDLATGQDVAMPQVNALYASTKNVDWNNIPDLVLTGDTLFMTLVTGRVASTNFPPNNVTNADVTLYELDHIFDAGAQPRPVARYHVTFCGCGASGANARLVNMGLGAWDRAEDRWVKFSSLPDGKGPAGLFVNGNILVTFDDYSNTSSQEITIYDTSRFPTAGG